ncbi:TonB-dependent receptor [Pseudomonas sp. sp1636]|uniref:TonB-dependent receptor plug domain-containing protein n=1 Tax=Pseudomonas sp. sp1636 TaxID=3036707 RepID=UPI0025A67258|nr:TonB-dependent receptor [Pseudomonas sp. sp1636]MDM8349882.1 TonB-dependent receptor [Pseudomonas sp. sp1636]
MPHFQHEQGRCVAINPAVARSLSLWTLLTANLAQANDLFELGQPLPEILTATRLQQAPAAVPGSISVLDRQLIRASGARSLPELLRLVPGMLVVPQSGNSTTVNYHGSSATQARRMQVLVDGRSVYRAGFAQVDWDDIPVALEDIERIEVFRGPNTVSYGANALMAVINILTRAPRDTHGTRLKHTRGQRGINDWYASHGQGWDGGDLRLSLSGLQDDGFDQRADDSDFRDSKRLNRLNLRLSQELDAKQSLDWQLALKEGTNQVDNRYEPIFPIAAQPWEQDRDSDVRARDFATSLRWNLDFNPEHSLYVQTNLQQWERLRQWRACEGQLAFSPALRKLWELSPQYTQSLLQNMQLPLGGSQAQSLLATQVLQQAAATFNPTSGAFAHSCGLINEDARESRFDLEVQDTLSLSDNLRLVSGLNYRHDRADSEVYLNGELSRDTWSLFSQFEWRIDPHWLLQGGAMLEDASATSASLSPRLALNYLITPAHGLRAVYSEAVRSPDMFENHADWQYRVRDLKPTLAGQSEADYFATAAGPGNLEQERIHSHELGYNGHFNDIGLSLDVKLFYDEIDNLISEPLKVYQFMPTNGNQLRLKGSETELNWQLSMRDRLRLGYAYIDYDASHRIDRRLTPRHSGSVGWLRDWGQDWSSALFYYGADQLNQYRFERLDLRVAKRMVIGSAALELAGVLQQRLDDEPLSWPANNYQQRHLLYFSAELEF